MWKRNSGVGADEWKSNVNTMLTAIVA